MVLALQMAPVTMLRQEYKVDSVLVHQGVSQKLRVKDLQRCWEFLTGVCSEDTVSDCLSGWNLRQVPGQSWKMYSNG